MFTVDVKQQYNQPNHFPSGTNGKVVVLGVPIFKHFRVSCELTYIERIRSNMIEHTIWYQFQFANIHFKKILPFIPGSIYLLKAGVI